MDVWFVVMLCHITEIAGHTETPCVIPMKNAIPALRLIPGQELYISDMIGGTDHMAVVSVVEEKLTAASPFTAV